MPDVPVPRVLSLIPSPRTSEPASVFAPVFRRVGRIEDHAYLGDRRRGALVDRDGAVDWLCLPRFDADAVFASVLGTAEHGLWRIAPDAGADEAATAPAADQRRYLGDSLVLESTWITRQGTVRLIDFMPVRDGGGEEPPRLLRIVEGVSGDVRMRSLLRARPGYGRTVPSLHASWRRASVDLGESRLWLEADAGISAGADGDLSSVFTIGAGESVTFALSWSDGHDTPPPGPSPEGLLQETLDYWADVAADTVHSGPHSHAVARSVSVLHALCHPSGAVVAAPTTSLPEELGGSRNWDYRYTWLRDSAFVVERLLACGHLDQARAWVGWLLTVMGRSPRGAEGLQIMYGIGGERDLTEYELGWLPGHEGSRPVRTGNAAATQLQLDVFGEVVSALFETQLRDPELGPVVAPLVRVLVEQVARLWEEPDEGIWEIRGQRRHFTHSKVMAWVALDRAVRLADAGHDVGPADQWRTLREQVHRQVCERGYDEDRNTLTQSYGSPELDASLLQMASYGFLPGDDKRLIGTVEAIQRELSLPGGYLLRYRTDTGRPSVDGLAGHEGAFLITLGWLLDALVRIGRTGEAAIYTQALLHAGNDVGLLAEKWDPAAGRQLGNFPQAFSHVAVLTACAALARAQGTRTEGAQSGTAFAV
ncbi:glycoside hydrolase family 15 protein [Streptomyces sp. NPDC059247]|uniref:glycoside hydrolase family 15 protein n=1 Tax=Streptomyces sp. NPDC059247 TaxID=3346790 RepID=UPI0036AA526E